MSPHKWLLLGAAACASFGWVLLGWNDPVSTSWLANSSMHAASAADHAGSLLFAFARVIVTGAVLAYYEGR